jgi:RNA polymerase sigma-70 factor, ECF subfamily
MNPAELSDEQIVKLCREKDKELYGEIIKRYGGKLSRYLRKFIGNEEDLNDALQEIFIKTYRYLYGFDVKKRFSPWIYRIAHNEAVNQIRRRHRDNVPLEDVEYKIIDEKNDVIGDLRRKVLKEDLERALADMKMKYREPLILFYFEQKSYEEIGEILRLPTGTVGTLISRGKKMLKEKLTLISNQYGKREGQ